MRKRRGVNSMSVMQSHIPIEIYVEPYVQVEINLKPNPVLPIIGFIVDRAKDILIVTVPSIRSEL